MTFLIRTMPNKFVVVFRLTVSIKCLNNPIESLQELNDLNYWENIQILWTTVILGFWRVFPCVHFKSESKIVLGFQSRKDYNYRLLELIFSPHLGKLSEGMAELLGKQGSHPHSNFKWVWVSSFVMSTIGVMWFSRFPQI